MDMDDYKKRSAFSDYIKKRKIRKHCLNIKKIDKIIIDNTNSNHSSSMVVSFNPQKRLHFIIIIFFLI